MDTRGVGAPIQRHEDPAVLRGKASYLDDRGLDAKAAAFVRSPHAHARILDIDVRRAIDTPGLHAIYTAEDLTGPLGEPVPMPLSHASLQNPRTPHALATDVVRHVGQPVAMIVAEDRYLAEDAAARIDVRYEPLTSVVGLQAAERASTLVHEDVPDNCASIHEVTVGDARGAYERAPHHLEFTLQIERSAAIPLEGRGVFASWDAARERLDVHSSTQTPTSLRDALASVLGLGQDQVVVRAPAIGGAFGLKIVHPWPEEVLVAWAAMLLQTPVKWAEDRWENFVASAHERAQEQHVRVAFDGQGHILALDVDILHDTGAYTPYGIIVPFNTLTHILGPYRIENYRGRIRSYYTNTAPVTPYRGAGRPQAAWCIERTLDRVASELEIDRTEIRMRNFVQPQDMPHETGLSFQDGKPVVYDSGDYPALMEMLKDRVGWDDFQKERAKAATEGRRVGLGVSCYVEGTGIGPYEGAFLRVEPDGTVNCHTGLSSQGQGHATMLAQVISAELGLDPAEVRVVTGDTERMHFGVGTFASRTAVVAGNAVSMAARTVADKAKRLASEVLEVDVADIELVDGHALVRGDPAARVSLGDLSILSNPLRFVFGERVREARRRYPIPTSAGDARGGEAKGTGSRVVDEAGSEFSRAPGLSASDYFAPANTTWAMGIHAAVVETDPVTAEIRVSRYVVAHDCGRVINPAIVEGQIHGGVAQGVGGALYERMAYDSSGQLLNASFMDFLMPYATEVPEVETVHMETPSPLNPLGVKGAGEAGVIPAAAAIASAVEDAEGFPVTQVPISPSDLFALRGQADSSTADS